MAGGENQGGVEGPAEEPRSARLQTNKTDIDQLARTIASARVSSRLIAQDACPWTEFKDVQKAARRAAFAEIIFKTLLKTVAVYTLCSGLGFGLYQAANFFAIARPEWPIQTLAFIWTCISLCLATALIASFCGAIYCGVFADVFPAYKRIRELEIDERKRLRTYKGPRIELEEAVRNYVEEGLYREDEEQILAEASFDDLARGIRARLRQTIEKHERAQKLHLLLGIVFGIIGVGALYVLGEDAIKSLSDANDLGQRYWAMMIGRGALAVAAQGFWLFFLWSYRRSVAEAKYFQLELTTIESKILGTQALSELPFLGVVVNETGKLEFSDTQMKVISMLMRGFLYNERHIILRRGEHTAYTHQLREDGVGFKGLFGSRTETTTAPNAPPPNGAAPLA